MTAPSNLTPDWPAELPEADAAEQRRAAYPEPALDPEDPLPPGGPAAVFDADEADLVEQSRELPWEDGDEER